MCRTCRTADLSRRAFLGGAVLLAAASTPVGTLFAADPPPAGTVAVSPAEALVRLQEGNARYVGGISKNRDYSVGRAARALDQRPFAAIISCADSRVAPELIFDQGPGDLFVIRVAGNFVNEDGLASLEYGTAVLGVSLVLVLGHTNCGAIKATIDVVKNGATLPGHLPALAASIAPAVEAAIAQNTPDLLVAATAENVRQNVDYLKDAKPIVSDQVAAGTVAVGGAIYDLSTGVVAAV